MSAPEATAPAAGGAQPWAEPARWLALLPLLIIPGCWVWWWVGAYNPGLQPGRAIQLLTIALALTPLLWAGRLPLPAAALPLCLAIGWLALTQAWNPLPLLGAQYLVERSAALAAAVAIAWWWARHRPERVLPAAAIAGAGCLLIAVATASGELGPRLMIGRDAPFGNPNFNAYTALPLLIAGTAMLAALPQRPVHLLLTVVAGFGLALALGFGWASGDPSRGAVLCLLASGALWLVLHAVPARWQLAVLAGLTAAGLAAWIAAFNGALDPARLDWSSAQRVFMWRAAVESLAGPALLGGHGTGSYLAVLPGQPSFSGFWLTLPSWSSHPHSELLNALVEGGLPLLALYGWAAWLTWAPLWRARREPAARALLLAWAAALVGLLIEVQGREPPGLFLLALLAGASWAWYPAELPRWRWALPVWVPPLAGGLLALAVGSELGGPSGSPTMIHQRALNRLDAIPPAEHAARLAELQRLRRWMGPLDDLDYGIATELGQLGRLAEGEQALLAQLARLPVHAPSLHLAARLRRAGKASPALLAAEQEARARAAAWLARVPENQRNAPYRQALERALANAPRPEATGAAGRAPAAGPATP